IETESRRDAALFLDAYWRLQRVLENARQITRFFLSKPPCDLRVAAIDRVLDYGRRLNPAIKHNREAMMNVRGSDVPELLGALGVKVQMDYPTILFIRRARVRYAIASKIGFLFDEQTFFYCFSVLALVFVSFDSEFWRNDLLSLVDLPQSFAVIGIHHTKL